MELARLVEYAVRPGPEQMALDEWLLLTADEFGPAFRCYGWPEPTLSLGYFQHAADRIPGLPYVRRHTGGGAIVHDDELTYAVVLPGDMVPDKGDETLVCRMHRLASEALAGWDVGPRVVPCGGETGRGQFLCFDHQTPGDLTLGGAKVVGSAQRRVGRAVLQHGSILLGRSAFAPHLAGVGGVPARPLAAAFERRVAADWDWRFEPTAVDEAAVARIAAEKYGNAEWNERR